MLRKIEMKKSFTAVLLGVLLFTLQDYVVGAAPASTNVVQLRQEARGLQLLRAGRYDQAISAYGQWAPEMGRELRTEAAAFEHAGKPQEAIRLYTAFFQ